MKPQSVGSDPDRHKRRAVSVHTAFTPDRHRRKVVAISSRPVSNPRPGTPALSATDKAVLRVLLDNCGKVVGRDTILRVADLDHLGDRRVDASIVVLRRVLGANAITTVRRRGWMLGTEFDVPARDILAR